MQRVWRLSNKQQEQRELTHVLVVHVPVGPLPIGNHLPHDDSVAPHVAGCGELPVGDGLWSRPSDGDLPSRGKIRPAPFLRQRFGACIYWVQQCKRFSKKFFNNMSLWKYQPALSASLSHTTVHDLALICLVIRTSTAHFKWQTLSCNCQHSLSLLS